MIRSMLPVALILALGTAAWADEGGKRAQDGLTPTDILPMGRFTADFALHMDLGTATLKAFSGALDESGDVKDFVAFLGVAVGVGMGVEIEAFLPYAFKSELKIDTANFDFENNAKGFGDLQIGANMTLIEETASSPHVMGGVFLIFPTGDDDPGQAKVTTPNPALNSSGRDGGIGEGAFEFGVQVGLSKRMENIEPYVLLRYKWGGSSDSHDVDTDHADIVTLLAGLEIHFGDAITIDARPFVEWHGKEIDKDSVTGAKDTEESHLQYGLQARLYAALGSSVALEFGVGIRSVEDHALSREADINLESTFLYSVEVGIRIVLGR